MNNDGFTVIEWTGSSWSNAVAMPISGRLSLEDARILADKGTAPRDVVSATGVKVYMRSGSFVKATRTA